MTAAYESIGTVVSSGANSVTPGFIDMSGTAIPSGSGDGFMAVIFWGNAADAPLLYDSAVWDFVGDGEGGGGTWGVGTGLRHASVYWTVEDLTGTTQTFTNGGLINDTANLMHGYILRFTQTLGYFVFPSAAEFADNISGSAFSATATTNPGGTTGDDAILALVTPTSTVNPAGLNISTWSGTTMGTNTLISTSPFTTGNDSRVAIRHRSITAGTAVAAPVVTSTTDFTGGGLVIRVRDTATPPAVPPIAVAGGDAPAEPWVLIPLDGSGSGYSSGATFLWSNVTVGGTGTVTITSPTSLVTTARVSPTVWADEDYTFRLTVTDPGGSDSDDLVKTVLRSSEFVNVNGVDKPLRPEVDIG